MNWIKTKYEDKDIGEVKVKYGKVHPYLGMTFNFEEEGKLKIIMREYIDKMINDFKYPEEIKSKVKTPAADYIFKINKKCNKLNKEKQNYVTLMWPRDYFYAREHILIYNWQLRF